MTNPLPSTPITPQSTRVNPVNHEEYPVIKKEDFVMAVEITKFSLDTSLTIMRKQEQDVKSSAEKQGKKPVPEPSDISMEYLLLHQIHVMNILKVDEIKIKDITRMKNYPNGTGGRLPAVKFVRGMEQNGLGKFSLELDSFKRYHPDDEDCPSREDVRRKWQRLCIE